MITSTWIGRLTPWINEATSTWWIGPSTSGEDTHIKAQGDPGPKGDPGDTGPTGATGSAGPPGQDGAQGIQGEQGPAGTNGTDGLAPNIGSNGNWWIGTTDTSTSARGPQGLPGTDGQDGAQGPSGPTPYFWLEPQADGTVHLMMTYDEQEYLTDTSSTSTSTMG